MDKASTDTPRTAFGQDRVVHQDEKTKADLYRRAVMVLEQLNGRKIRAGESEALYAGITNREDGDTNWWGLAMAAELAKDGYTIADDSTIKKVLKGKR